MVYKTNSTVRSFSCQVHEYETIRHAAKVKGKGTSEYIRDVILPEARKTVKEYRDGLIGGVINDN